MRRALFLLLVYVGIAAAQPTAKFPAAAATWADLLQAKDNSRSTLSGAIDNSTLSVPVVDGAKFTAWQAVLIENEKLLVCSVSSNTLTICATGRGWGGTGAASHTSGLAVIGLNFQEHHNGLAAEIAAIEAALGPNLSNVASTWGSISGKPDAWLNATNLVRTITDANTAMPSGFYDGTGIANTPFVGWGNLLNVRHTSGVNNNGFQLASKHGAVGLWYRNIDDAAGTWRRLVNDDGSGKVGFGGQTSPAYAVDVTGDVNVTGNFRVNGTVFTGGVTSVFTRSGAVTAQTGDYTAAQVTNAVSTAGSYSDPSWLTLTKSKVGLANVDNTSDASKPISTAEQTALDLKAPLASPTFTGTVNGITKAMVGLGSVENTALSTWAGSANITTLGTIAAGTVPWARLSSVPSTFTPAAHTHPVADLSTVGDYSSKITSGTYSIGITGNAGTVGGIAVATAGAAPGANQIVRTEGNGYTYTGWINTVSGDNGTTAIGRVYASHDAFLRYYTLANFAKQSTNAVTHDASFAWDDPYIALPTAQVMYGVFSAQAAQATITKVWCWADTSDAVINLRRSDTYDMITGNLTCTTGGASSTSINAYGVIPLNYSVGLYYISGTAKQIRVGISYTTAY